MTFGTGKLNEAMVQLSRGVDLVSKSTKNMLNKMAGLKPQDVEHYQNAEKHYGMIQSEIRPRVAQSEVTKTSLNSKEIAAEKQVQQIQLKEQIQNVQSMFFADASTEKTADSNSTSNVKKIA